MWMMRSGRGTLLVLMLFLGAAASGILANSDHPAVRRVSPVILVAGAILVYLCLPESLFRPSPEGVISTRFIFFPVVVLLACIVRRIAGDTRYYPGHRR